MDKLINLIYLVLGIIIGALCDLYKNVYLLGYQSCFKTIQLASMKPKSMKEENHDSK